MSRVLYATILLLFFTTKSTRAIDFRVQPSGDIIIPLNGMLNKTFHCELSSGEPFWSVFEDPNKPLSTQDEGDRITLNQRGITFSFSDTFANITVPGIAENNGTLIYCAANVHGINEFSVEAPITLKILGPPLPPDPKLTFHFPYNLEIHWAVPFSHDSVQGYNLQIFSESSMGSAVLDKLMLYNETSYNFSFHKDTVLNCHILTINVTAISELGESSAGIKSSGFSTAPQPFKSEVKIEVTFLRDGTPMTEVSFEAPFICTFQTANYTITIEDISSHGLRLSAVSRQSNYTGENRMILEMFTSELWPNKNYTLTIDVEDNNFPLDIASTSKNFSTIFDPFDSIRDQQIGMYIGSLGGIVLLVLLASLVVFVVAFACLKKRKSIRDPPPREATEPATMYESITEYQFNDYHAISEAEKKRMLILQEQHQKQKALLVGREEVDTYQYMSSAAGLAQGVSRTQFIYHPYTTDSSTAMMMNQGTDLGLNYPCPAAAGSSSNPVHNQHADQSLSLPLSVRNAAYVGDPLPNGESAAADDHDDHDDHDEYTSMSRAGTLTGQGVTSTPQSVSGQAGIAVGQPGEGNMQYHVELQGNVDQSGHSKAYAVMVTEC